MLSKNMPPATYTLAANKQCARVPQPQMTVALNNTNTRQVPKIDPKYFVPPTKIDLPEVTEKFLKNPSIKTGSAAHLTEMASFPEILIEGGDDRILLDPVTGVNKYFMKPEELVDAAFRGSCTCNSPSEYGMTAAEEAYNALYQHKISTEAMMDDIRNSLIQAYGMPKGTGVFLTPSGSDAEYIPLLIAKLLNPGKEIVNIVTCHQEVGSGSLEAAGGKFFSSSEPMPGSLNEYGSA